MQLPTYPPPTQRHIYQSDTTYDNYFIRDEYVRIYGECYFIKTGLKEPEPFEWCSVSGRCKGEFLKTYYKDSNMYTVGFSNTDKDTAYIVERDTRHFPHGTVKVYDLAKGKMTKQFGGGRWHIDRQTNSGIDILGFDHKSRAPQQEVHLGVVLFDEGRVLPLPTMKYQTKTLGELYPQDAFIGWSTRGYIVVARVESGDNYHTRRNSYLLRTPDGRDLPLDLSPKESSEGGVYWLKTKPALSVLDQLTDSYVGYGSMVCRFSSDSSMFAIIQPHKVGDKTTWGVAVFDSATATLRKMLIYPAGREHLLENEEAYPMDVLFVKGDSHIWVLFSNRTVCSFDIRPLRSPQPNPDCPWAIKPLSQRVRPYHVVDRSETSDDESSEASGGVNDSFESRPSTPVPSGITNFLASFGWK